MQSIFRLCALTAVQASIVCPQIAQIDGSDIRLLSLTLPLPWNTLRQNHSIILIVNLVHRPMLTIWHLKSGSPMLVVNFTEGSRHL